MIHNASASVSEEVKSISIYVARQQEKAVWSPRYDSEVIWPAWLIAIDALNVVSGYPIHVLLVNEVGAGDQFWTFATLSDVDDYWLVCISL